MLDDTMLNQEVVLFLFRSSLDVGISNGRRGCSLHMRPLRTSSQRFIHELGR